MHGCEGLSMDQKEGRRALHERAWPAFDFFRPMRRGFIRFFFVRRRMRWGTLCYLCNYPPPALPINPKGLSRVWLPTENVARDLPTFIFFLGKTVFAGKTWWKRICFVTGRRWRERHTCLFWKDSVSLSRFFFFPFFRRSLNLSNLLLLRPSVPPFSFPNPRSSRFPKIKIEKRRNRRCFSLIQSVQTDIQKEKGSCITRIPSLLFNRERDPLACAKDFKTIPIFGWETGAHKRTMD